MRKLPNMKDYFCNLELAGLAGMPQTVSAVIRKAKKEHWQSRPRQGRGGGLEYHISSLPPETQLALKQKFFKEQRELEKEMNPAESEAREIAEDPNIQGVAYSDAAEYSRRKADKYLIVIEKSFGLKGKMLMDWVDEWNTLHPEMKTSYFSIIRARKIYETEGTAGLLGRWGNRAGATTVSEECFDFFRNHYLSESMPSASSVWTMTLGYAIKRDSSLDVSKFPSQVSFLRLLERRVPKDVIYYARHGFMAWNRKYADYIKRDYSEMKAGECWVSDHAQIDVLADDGKTVKAPWLTAWMDAKTGKFLGWNIHMEPPSSDFVFEAFYIAAMKFGLPQRVLLDNGKDYRCRDFAGGRTYETRVKVEVDELSAKPMLYSLGVIPHFAIPYNAQAKPIERQFCKFKGWFSRRFETYRGGNVVERPETLTRLVRSGKAVKFEELKEAMNEFIEEMFNNFPSNGRVLKGRTPNQAWAEEFLEKREVRKEALKLFCMRSSGTVSIGRNGIRDSRFDVQYYGEWMSGYKGVKVYFKRPPDEMETVWVFDSSDNSYLGEARLVSNVPFFAETEADRELLRSEMARKNRDRKRTAEQIKEMQRVSHEEQLVYLKTGTDAIADTAVDNKVTPISRVANSSMDKVVLQIKNDRERETWSLNGLKPKKQNRPTPIFAFEADRIAYENSLKGEDEE